MNLHRRKQKVKMESKHASMKTHCLGTFSLILCLASICIEVLVDFFNMYFQGKKAAIENGQMHNFFCKRQWHWCSWQREKVGGFSSKTYKELAIFIIILWELELFYQVSAKCFEKTSFSKTRPCSYSKISKMYSNPATFFDRNKVLFLCQSAR